MRGAWSRFPDLMIKNRFAAALDREQLVQERIAMYADRLLGAASEGEIEPHFGVLNASIPQTCDRGNIN